MENSYKNLIFTKHALVRLKDRSINYAHLVDVVNYPDQKFHQKDQTWKFIRTINQRKIHVVANYLEKDQKWLVISVWVRGEEDRPSVIWWLLSLPFRIIWKMFLALLKLAK